MEMHITSGPQDQTACTSLQLNIEYASDMQHADDMWSGSSTGSCFCRDVLVLPPPVGPSSDKSETHWGWQTRVPAQDTILLCSTSVQQNKAQ